MMQKSAGVLTLVLTLTLAMPAFPARADDTEDDLKCLTVSLALAAAPDDATQSVGLLSSMFWLGRLDGRSPQLEFESRLMAAVAAMKPEDYPREEQRCADIMRARGSVLTKLSRDLEQRKGAH